MQHGLCIFSYMPVVGHINTNFLRAFMRFHIFAGVFVKISLFFVDACNCYITVLIEVFVVHANNDIGLLIILSRISTLIY